MMMGGGGQGGFPMFDQKSMFKQLLGVAAYLTSGGLEEDEEASTESKIE